MGKQAKLKQQRREEKIAAAQHHRSKKPSLFIVVLLVVVVAVVAVVVLNADSGSLATGDVTVVGDGLPVHEGNAAADPALGMAAPTLEGIGLDGKPLTIEPGGGAPTIVLFLAHWCEHCNAELDALVPYLQENPLDEVELLGVSTFADSSRPNYPPTTWLEDRGWTAPTLLDSQDVSAGDAYGISGTPFWVYLNADGEVVGRWSGELGIDEFEATVAQLSS